MPQEALYLLSLYTIQVLQSLSHFIFLVNTTKAHPSLFKHLLSVIVILIALAHNLDPTLIAHVLLLQFLLINYHKLYKESFNLKKSNNNSNNPHNGLT